MSNSVNYFEFTGVVVIL